MNVAGQNLADKSTSESSGSTEKSAGQKLIALILSIMPWAIVGGLLYAGLFVKPTPVIEKVVPHAIDQRDILFGLTRVGEGEFIAVGNYGKIVKTTDTGHTWEVQKSPIDIHFQDIDSWDAERAVAVGNRGRVVVTSDGGKTWTEVEAPKSEVSNKLIRVHTYPNGEALAAGEMGMILQSTDYGKTWHRMRKEEDIFMNDVTRVTDQRIVVAAEFGQLFKSEDNGETWEDLYTDSPNSFTAVKFRNPQEGVAVGLAGAIVATFDGGNTWTFYDRSVTGMPEHLMDVTWSEELNEWVGIGNKGKWITFSPDMKEFHTRNLSDKDFTSHAELELTEDGKGFLAVGETEGFMDLENNKWELLHD